MGNVKYIPLPKRLAGNVIFSERLQITKMVAAWYEAHPELPLCTFNTITALSALGLLKRPKKEKA